MPKMGQKCAKNAQNMRKITQNKKGHQRELMTFFYDVFVELSLHSFHVFAAFGVYSYQLAFFHKKRYTYGGAGFNGGGF